MRLADDETTCRTPHPIELPILSNEAKLRDGENLRSRRVDKWSGEDNILSPDERLPLPSGDRDPLAGNPKQLSRRPVGSVWAGRAGEFSARSGE